MTSRPAVMTCGSVRGDDLHAGGPRAGDHDLGDDRVGEDLQRQPARAGGLVTEVALGAGVATAPGRALLEGRDALLALPVVVLDLRDPEPGGGGVHEGDGCRGQVVLAGDLDRTAGAAEVALAVLPVLEPLEGRQHVVVGPALAALVGPVVEVLPVAPHEEHAVDRAGAAQHLAAGLGDGAVPGVLLRGGLVAPVEQLLQLRRRVHHRDGARDLEEHLRQTLVVAPCRPRSARRWRRSPPAAARPRTPRFPRPRPHSQPASWPKL